MRLRVKELDFAYRQLTVRDSKGKKDRLSILPQTLVAPLQTQLRYACRNISSPASYHGQDWMTNRPQMLVVIRNVQQCNHSKS